jgi:uncharacterized membrane protein YgcG
MSGTTTPSETLLLTSLSKYFEQHSKHCDQFKTIVNGNHPISLRIVDWFVTHYAKQRNVFYYVNIHKDEMYMEFPQHQDSNHIKKFHLYLEYRAQLKSYTKYHFDPFRRHERISFIIANESKCNKPETVETTVGQLNFFRWALQNHVIEYIQSNLRDINESMLEFQVKKRQEPTKSPSSKSSRPTGASGAGGSGGGGSGAGNTSSNGGNTFFQMAQQIPAHCQLRFD